MPTCPLRFKPVYWRAGIGAGVLASTAGQTHLGSFLNKGCLLPGSSTWLLCFLNTAQVRLTEPGPRTLPANTVLTQVGFPSVPLMGITSCLLASFVLGTHLPLFLVSFLTGGYISLLPLPDHLEEECKLKPFILKCTIRAHCS